MNKELEGVLRMQENLFGRIARAYENLKKSGAANITIGLVEARLQALENNWGKFEAQHEKLLHNFGESLAESDYIKKDRFTQVEDAFLHQKGLFLDALRQLKDRSLSETIKTSSEMTAASKTTLPRIQLPVFSGKYEDWPSFRDLFQSIIGKDSSTPQVEKLHYLKSCLKKEAELLIRNLPTTDENFERAWNILKDYYENKRLLVRSYLSQFTAFTKLKSESATDLRQLYHCILNTVGSLESIGRPITKCEDLFVFLIVELLDPRSRREWENSISDTTEPPEYHTLQQFLERRLHTLESLLPAKSDGVSTKSTSNASRQTRVLHSRDQKTRRNRCSLCNQDHFIMFCEEYRGKSSGDKRKIINAANLCLNCLGKHKLDECQSKKSCSKCNARHHSSLHDSFNLAEIATTSHVSCRPTKTKKTVLLATARILVTDRFGTQHLVRALLDQGSESSLITETLAQHLRLPRTSSSVSIYGVGGKRTSVSRGSVNFEISPRFGGSSITVSALILPQLTSYNGSDHADYSSWNHLQNLELADPEFLNTDPIHVILGAEVYSEILQQGLCRGGAHEPVAQKTKLGWILSGVTGRTTEKQYARTHLCNVDQELPAIVQRFWQQEEVNHMTYPMTEQEKQCEEYFSTTYRRNADGRYVVRLPLLHPLPDFSVTRCIALRMLRRMEQRFASDDHLRLHYLDFMREYQELGHMSIVETSSTGKDKACFLPHHGVMREASTTTKLRVVFNGSTPTATQDTLNKHLMVGPNLLPTLDGVLLRWRVHRFVLAADIEKMYRQILVDPRDRKWQRIMWRYDPSLEAKEYELATVTYGLACAPFLAIRTLRQLANDEEARFPQAATTLKNDTYMDDILTGAPTLDKAKNLQQELQGLCMAGGFPLRKWSSNDAQLLSNIPLEHRIQRDKISWQPHESHGTLGLQWHPSIDSFSFSSQKLSVATYTKRSVLSLTARLFDPLGWLAPAVVRAKILFQSTWLQGVDWDSPLDEGSTRAWSSFQSELSVLEDIKIPRRLPLDAGNHIEFHGFSDASERAYAAVVYIRTRDEAGNITVSLVAAKTKVTPLKQVTLSRLELCAAVLLVRLMSRILRELKSTHPIYLWSDSTVVLGWLRGHPSRWKTYVANRVSEIQTTLPEASWHHILGPDNPADCASRGVSPKELVSHPLWWHGPPWLTEEHLPLADSNRLQSNDDLPEERCRVHTSTVSPKTIDEPDELLRFSSLNRLLRVTTWLRRWLSPRKTSREVVINSGRTIHGYTLSTAELEATRFAWITKVQTLHFSEEIDSLKGNSSVPKRSSLAKLTPFLDPQGILRVGGRLKHAILSYDEKHPIILPFTSHFTRLVAEASHLNTLHGGVQLTLGSVRQKYWIPRGRALVKTIIHRCVTCVRWRAATPQQIMGNLPSGRLIPARPFLNTGVDYAGPILLRTTKGRGHRSHKAYIAVFVCLSTKAVHLEVVSDYTADAFLAALRRFISRRGLCHSLTSDCGTNFVGADAQLRAFFSASNPEQKRIADQLAKDQIHWRFNPPAAPHFGGLWEAAVKSLKHHLRRVLGDATLTYEEMSTLLAQVEACLNSRPLLALSDDADDLAALTPGHFLIGSALNAIPEASSLEQKENHLNRWQLLQKMRDHFWQRWSHEYIHSLTQRPKWCTPSDSIKIGRLCLIRNEITSPNRWPLARVIAVHPGADGHVRVVTVRTATSELLRPISKLVLLPHSDAES